MKATRLFALILGLYSANCFAENNVAIAIHGGAGTISKAKLTPTQTQQYKDKLKEAVSTGYAVLKKGGTSTDAVVAAIKVLEASPLFNAGVGAVYTWNEEHELDASIMEGSGKHAGAVAGVKRIKSPIDAARRVMDRSPHVMLSGEGAETFAAAHGLELVSNDYFDTPHRKEALERVKLQMQRSDHAYIETTQPMTDYKFGTVGAVALDQYGNLAAGTSTGGMTAKRWGRIGDSPVIGAGTWADNSSCAVSATGHGEYFIRYHVAADICSRVKYQQVSIVDAGYQVIYKDLVKAGGEGGVIILDPQGNITMPYNTEGMYRASVDTQGRISVAIFSEVETIEPESSVKAK